MHMYAHKTGTVQVKLYMYMHTTFFQHNFLKKKSQFISNSCGLDPVHSTWDITPHLDSVGWQL